jgi:hypothetical protein
MHLHCEDRQNRRIFFRDEGEDWELSLKSIRVWRRRADSNRCIEAKAYKHQVIWSDKQPGFPGCFIFAMSLSATVYHLKLEHSWNVFLVATLTPLGGSAPQQARTLGASRSR